MSLKRVDQLLQVLFPELTRSKIQSLIEKSKIKIKTSKNSWEIVKKAGRKLEDSLYSAEHFFIEEDEEIRFVSRGALKLQGAASEFQLDFQDMVCLDVGVSTGGFSDFLLQSGAKKVLGIDVGRDQLHASLKKEPRLLHFDKVNAKEPISETILDQFFKEEIRLFDRIVVDVSFISLTKILPVICSYLKPSGLITVLIKPQFELSRKELNKKGVVKDLSLIEAVVEKIDGVFVENGLKPQGCCASPIEGDNGNKEMLMVATKF